MRTKLLQTCVVGVVFGLMGCSATGDDPDPTTSGGRSSGGTGSGGAPNQSGGTSSGGAASGGTNVGTGGSGTGGTSSGGTSSGGAASGGRESGGAPSGGTGAGGRTDGTGGSSRGGMGSGGATGGSGSGGTPGGGRPGTGGSSAAGAPGTGGGTSALNCNAPALTNGAAHCSSNQSGKANGYTWTIWSSGSGGCLTTYDGAAAAFKATWNNSGDFLARVGIQWDETKTFDQYGTIEADYAFKKSGSAGGFSFIGIYGWSNNPLVEYYIVEDWYGNGPPTGGGQQKGTLDIDGGTYKIYTHTQNNQPSIHGNATFPQFFSVRQQARQCGHISITEHFKKWASLGMNMGKMYEAKILVEAGGGQGQIDFTQASLTAK